MSVLSQSFLRNELIEDALPKLELEAVSVLGARAMLGSDDHSLVVARVGVAANDANDVRDGLAGDRLPPPLERRLALVERGDDSTIGVDLMKARTNSGQASSASAAMASSAGDACDSSALAHTVAPNHATATAHNTAMPAARYHVPTEREGGGIESAGGPGCTKNHKHASASVAPNSGTDATLMVAHSAAASDGHGSTAPQSN